MDEEKKLVGNSFSLRTNTVINAVSTSSFGPIDLEIFQEDFFNFDEIPENLKTESKILEYSIYTMIPEIFSNESRYSSWRNSSFLNLCKAGLNNSLSDEIKNSLNIALISLNESLSEFAEKVYNYKEGQDKISNAVNTASRKFNGLL